MKRLPFLFVVLFSSLIFLSGCYTHFQIQTRERTHESVVADSAQETTIYQSLVLQNELYPFSYLYPYSLQYRPWYSYPYGYYINPWGHSWKNNWYFGLYWDTHQFGYWGFSHKKPNWNPPEWVSPPKNPGIFRPIPRTRDNSGGERGYDRNQGDRNRSREEMQRPKESEKNPPRNQDNPKQNERRRESIDSGKQNNPPPQRESNTRGNSERSSTERKR
ncbi:MAG: hypothetical protein LiPW41_733 [Parcubacteria group bacterium LiPW_41]|nr:MAG: hypothetical protein LiPW41_733 [Parcubacteria group bacterium LiPW_41]